MSVYQNSEQLYKNLQALFTRIQSEFPDVVHSVYESRLIIRFKITRPKAEILINGRINPVEVSYGSSKFRPDLDIELPADALHSILMQELSLKKAMASGQLRVRGSLFKSFVLEDIFLRGQNIYAQVFDNGGEEISQG